MKKYRASLFLLAIALVFALIHFFIGWNDYVIESETAGVPATVQDWLWRYAKEETESFPAEISTLALELALFAGIFKLFKPYDEDTEKIKDLEERIMDRFDKLDRNGL